MVSYEKVSPFPIDTNRSTRFNIRRNILILGADLHIGSLRSRVGYHLFCMGSLLSYDNRRKQSGQGIPQPAIVSE